MTARDPAGLRLDCAPPHNRGDHVDPAHNGNDRLPGKN